MLIKILVFTYFYEVFYVIMKMLNGRDRVKKSSRFPNLELCVYINAYQEKYIYLNIE